MTRRESPGKRNSRAAVVAIARKLALRAVT
jgi:hypothetical protein